MGRRKDASKAYWTHREKAAKSLVALIENRATQPAALEAAWNPLLADDNTTREQNVDLRFQLKAVLTAREWAAVFPPPRVVPSADAKVKAGWRRTDGLRS